MGFSARLVRSIGGSELATAQAGPAGLPVGEARRSGTARFRTGRRGWPWRRPDGGFGADFGFDSADDLLTMEDGQFALHQARQGSPERRLSRMVEISEERAAKILRKWAANQPPDPHGSSRAAPRARHAPCPC